MTKLIQSIPLKAAVALGMDFGKSNMVPVYVYGMSGAMDILGATRGKTVHVTTGRTCLIVDGVPCVAVSTSAPIKLYKGNTRSLGQATWFTPSTIVFDRTRSRVSFDCMQSAVAKAVDAHNTCAMIAARLRAVADSRKAHPILARRAREACKAEMAGRVASHKAGHERAVEIARDRERRAIESLGYAAGRFVRSIIA